MDPHHSLQPFFEHFGQAGARHCPKVNPGNLDRLRSVLQVPVEATGRGILLRSPRAGYGKSHLLEQLRTALAGSHEFIPLRPGGKREIDPRTAVEDALRRLTRQLPAGAGLTVLDLHARSLLAHALHPLVISGEVPSHDPEAAAAALKERPVETFDFNHPQAVTAHWARENFEVLGPRLALEVSRTTGCPMNQVAFWLASLFRFAVTSPDHPGRAGSLLQSAGEEASAESFGTLLALLTQFQRIVILIDDLESVHGDPVGARRVAGFLATLREEAPRIDAVVSINDDVWESAFVPALSGGLLDRLSEKVIRFEPMSDEAIVAMLDSRVPDSGSRLLARMELTPADRFPRGILRQASELLEAEPTSAPSTTDPDESFAPQQRVVGT